jgi:hypothetical protein
MDWGEARATDASVGEWTLEAGAFGPFLWVSSIDSTQELILRSLTTFGMTDCRSCNAGEEARASRAHKKAESQVMNAS